MRCCLPSVVHALCPVSCALAGSVPFDLVQGDDPLTAQRLNDMAAQKEKKWQQLLSSVSTAPDESNWT